MTKVTTLLNKEKYSWIYLKNIKTLNCITKLVFFILLYILAACSSVETPQTKKTKWKYPPTNPYPTIMKQVNCQDDTPCLVVQLKTESLHFGCTLRNDSPYYWCGVNGLLAYPDHKLPKKVGIVFHTVFSEKTKKVVEKLISDLKRANRDVYLVSPPGYFIDNESNEFTNKMFGIYNHDICVDMFYDYSICPKTAKKFDVFTNKFIHAVE